MKAWNQILVFMLFLGNSWCDYTKMKPKPTKPPITTYYISNWQNYKIPSEISVESLKSILELISKYQDELYCPFGNFEYCEEKSLKEIITKIVNDIVTAEDMKKKQIESFSVCNLANNSEVSPARSIGMCMANYLKQRRKLKNPTYDADFDDVNDQPLVVKKNPHKYVNMKLVLGG